MKDLIINRIQCNHCKEEITSYHRHDFKMCSCGKIGIDGGLMYRRFIGHEYTDLAVYSDEPFEKVRQYCYRNGYGKNMKGPFQTTFLKDMTDEHLNALLTYCLPINQFLPLYKMEIEYRKENNITINDRN